MIPEMDKQSHSLAEYRARLDVAMGGRVAEELIYGADNVTDGASSDISSATNIASSMVRRFGFSDAVGPVAHTGQASDGEPQPSEETLRVIDGEIRSLVEGAQARARECLTAKKVELERLARALVEYETLDYAEVQKGAWSLLPPLPSSVWLAPAGTHLCSVRSPEADLTPPHAHASSDQGRADPADWARVKSGRQEPSMCSVLN